MKSNPLQYTLTIIFLFTGFFTYAQPISEIQDSIYANYVIKPEKTIELIKQIIPLYKKEKDWENYIYSIYDLSYHYYLVNDISKSEEEIKRSVREAKEKKIAADNALYGYVWNFYGVIAYEKNDFSNAIHYFEKAISVDTIQSEIDYQDISTKYANIAQIYTDKGDYVQALHYLKKALFIQKKYVDTDENLIHLYSNTGYNYQQLKEYLKANDFFNNGLNLLKKYSPNNRDYNEHYKFIYFNTATNHLAQGNYEACLKFLNKQKNLPLINKKDLSKIYNYTGEAFLGQQKYQLALDTLQKSLKLRKEVFPSKHYSIAITHTLIGNTYRAQKNYTKALNSYQSAIIAVVYDFDNKNINNNPALDNIVHQVELLKSLSAKAKTLQLMKKYKQSLEVYQLCSQLIDKMRTSFKHSGSKLFFMEQGNTIYEEAIVTALALGDKNTAFQFAEKSKAMLLLEAMRGIEARFGLPDDLVKKEKDLKIDITYYERKIWEERQKDEPNEENIKKWESLIFDLKEEYSALKEQLETDYPDYYQLQYNSNVISVKEVQKKLLNSKTAMISYFIGEEKVYVFTITKKGIEVATIHKTDNLTNWVNNMRLCLKRDSRISNYHATYYETAFQLYSIFLQPALKKLPKGIERIIIIPDDQLNFIPFETLLTSNLNLSSPRYELSKVPYLIKDYQISYGYSGTLLLEGLKRRKKDDLKIFGGFVPYFKGGTSERRGCDNDVLGNLAVGRQNIQTINSIMDGQLHFDDEANVEDFKTLANQYKILHLCTHACAEMDFKDTRIYFSDKELLAFELYNVPLNAQLAVLSACETGVGELKRGEGIMSLARAFMYSGCPSVVTSLWSVDDKSTSEIMRFFYKNLKNGMTKDAALHHAKLEYLDGKGIEESHPYYWSGFVHIGNTEPLFGNESSNWIWWIGGGALVLALIGFRVFSSKRE